MVAERRTHTTGHRTPLALQKEGGSGAATSSTWYEGVVCVLPGEGGVAYDPV